MKHLPKHLRQRWRYLGVGIEAPLDATIDRGAFQRELWYAAQNLVGDAGSAEADLTVYGFRYADGDGAAVVRIRRGEESRARAVVACVAAIDGHPVRTTVRGVSGTVRGCEERYIRRPLESTAHETVAFAGGDRPAVVRGRRVDLTVGSARVGATTSDI